MILPTKMEIFGPGEEREIVGRAKVTVRVVSLFLASNEGFEFEILDVAIRPREPVNGKKEERSLLVGEGVLHGVFFTETNFRAPALVMQGADGMLHAHDEVVAKVRRIGGGKDSKRELRLAFELGDM